MDVNTAGTIVGWADDMAGVQRAFLDDAAGMRTVGTIGTASTAYGVSDAGTVVGDYTLTTGDKRAFVYADGSMQDLTALIPAGSGWVLTTARDVNGTGQIVGTGTINGVTHAYLLTPVPEPRTVVGVAVLSSAVLARRRHRRR